MRKDDFIASFKDELRGLLMDSFEVESRSQKLEGVPRFSLRGAYLDAVIERSLCFLGRAYDAMQGKAIGTDELVDLFMRHYLLMTPEQGKEVTEKLRVRLKNGEKKP